MYIDNDEEPANRHRSFMCILMAECNWIMDRCFFTLTKRTKLDLINLPLICSLITRAQMALLERRIRK